MKKTLLLLLLFSLLLITPASSDTSGTNYTLRSNLKKDLTITGSNIMLGDLDMNSNDILNAGSVSFTSLSADDITVSGLTATRVTFAGVGGLLSDDADLTFITDTLYATNLTSTGTGTFGTITDGTASLTGGVGTGYTLTSPVISGHFSWTGDSVLQMGDDDKVFQIGGAHALTVRSIFGNDYLEIHTALNSIRFGNTTTDPAYDFAGSGTSTFEGDVVVEGDLKTDGGRIVNTTNIDNTDSPYTVLSSDHIILCNTTAGDITVNLPAGVIGTEYSIKNTGTGTVTVDGNGAETIDGELTQRVSRLNCPKIIFDGITWWII